MTEPRDSGWLAVTYGRMDKINSDSESHGRGRQVVEDC